MATEGNNMNKEIAETRDAFFSEGERDYFRRLIKSPAERLVHYKLVNKNELTIFERKKQLSVI